MAEEIKIFTKAQLIEKLTEVAKKQKEKNDVILQQKDDEIKSLSNDLNNAISSLNEFKQTQEEILYNVNSLSEENKKIMEENTDLKNKIKNLETKNAELIEVSKISQKNTSNEDTNKYVAFYDSIVSIIKQFENTNTENTNTENDNAYTEIDTKEKKPRKSKVKKNNTENDINQDELNTVEEAIINSESQLNSQDDLNKEETNQNDEDSIDVDALLSEL